MSQNSNPGQPPPGGFGGPPPGGYGGPPPGGYGVPPAGGFGAPSGYGPPGGIQAPIPPPPTQGSVGLGFCAGFFGGCIGYVLVRAIAKGADTKRGAGYGFACQIVLGAVMRLLNH